MIRIQVTYADGKEKEVELHPEEAFGQIEKLNRRMAFGDPDLVAFKVEKVVE